MHTPRAGAASAWLARLVRPVWCSGHADMSISLPIYGILEKSGCNLGPIRHPMSIQARMLVTGLLEYCQHNCLRVGMTVPGAVAILVDGWNPLHYEEAIVRADEKCVIKLLRRQPPPKDSDTLLSRLRLDGLFDGKWESAQRKDAHARPLDQRPHAMLFRETAQLAGIYEYLTQHFLLGDFSLSELYKIIDISRRYQLDDVKAACAQVRDPAKRHVAYMMKILEDRARQAEFARKRVDTLVANGASKIRELVRMANTPVRVYNPTDGSIDDWLRRLEVEREIEISAADYERNRGR